MKAIRETSFISSATSSQESPEYKLILRLTPELRTAIQDDLQDISDSLLSCGMITQDGHEDFTNCYKSTHTRAASLIRAVQNRIKSDRHYFSKFVQVLEKNKQYYNSILQKLYSHGMDSPPMYSQYHVYEDDLDEADETGALLHAPYVPYKDEPQQSKSGRISVYSLCYTVYLCCSSCMEKLVDLACDHPFICILLQFMVSIPLIILLGQLLLNVTTAYGFFLTLLLLLTCVIYTMCLLLLSCFCIFVHFCED